MASSDTSSNIYSSSAGGAASERPAGTVSVSSSAFVHGDLIPQKFGCDGQGLSPDLVFANYPAETKTFALIAEDPDAPGGTFDHWIVWNILPADSISEGNVPGRAGVNSKGKNGYTPPCPPDRQHRYFFRVYALDAEIELPTSAGKKELLRAIGGHVLATGELMGLYNKAAKNE